MSTSGNTGLDALADAKLLTVGEVATLLGMSTAWVRQHASGVRAPRIPSIKLGKSRRFRAGAVLEFISRMESAA